MESRQRNGIDGGRTKNRFREFHKLVRAIPIDVFADDEQRQNLIQAVQKALDEAIDIEEEEAWKMSWIDASVDEFCRGMGSMPSISHQLDGCSWILSKVVRCILSDRVSSYS